MLLSDGYLSSSPFLQEHLDDEAKEEHQKLVELFKKLKSAKEENDKAVLRDKIEQTKEQLFKNIDDAKPFVVEMLKEDTLKLSERYLREKKHDVIANIEQIWEKYEVGICE
mgnify:CR=1 FL=1